MLPHAASIIKQKRKDGRGDSSTGGPSLTAVCIKLKRKGPCGTADQFCLDGECVSPSRTREESEVLPQPRCWCEGLCTKVTPLLL